MQKLIILITISLMTSNILTAQELGYWLKVLNNDTKEALAFATIQIKTNGERKIANENGILHVKHTSEADTLQVDHIGFETKIIFITALHLQKDTIKVLLKPNFSILPPVSISPPNPDTILVAALSKFLENLDKDYCSTISFRGTLQVNNSYKQWVEAIGEAMFFYKHTNTAVPQKLLFEKTFEAGRAVGNEIKGELSFSGITIPSHALAILPWHLQNYQKKIKYSQLNDAINAGLIQITLSPLQKAEKELRKLDTYFGYLGQNAPALFNRVNRIYWVNLIDTTFVSIELISNYKQKASFDHNKRIYSYRRYYYSFNQDKNSNNMTNAFSTLRYTLPKKPDLFTYQTELKFNSACDCPKQEKEYATRYGILANGNDRNQWSWDQQEKYITYNPTYFGLRMKKLPGSNHKPLLIAPFVYKEKAMLDLKEARGIELFRD